MPLLLPVTSALRPRSRPLPVASCVAVMISIVWSLVGASRGLRARAYARNVEPHAIQACLRGQEQSPAVITAPCEVMWMLRTQDRAEVVPLGRQNPQSA